MMRITAESLEQLLYEDEGATLDFKQEQYEFEGATPEKKGELLKDILAFANAWRRSDAFILIGVEEVRGGRSIVRGISTHLQDSSVQQFVNSKTNRPVQFSYQAHKLDEMEIAVLHISLQERPLYLRKDFGRLKANDVSMSAEVAPQM